NSPALAETAVRFGFDEEVTDSDHPRRALLRLRSARALSVRPPQGCAPSSAALCRMLRAAFDRDRGMRDRPNGWTRFALAAGAACAACARFGPWAGAGGASVSPHTAEA